MQAIFKNMVNYSFYHGRNCQIMLNNTHNTCFWSPGAGKIVTVTSSQYPEASNQYPVSIQNYHMIKGL